MIIIVILTAVVLLLFLFNLKLTHFFPHLKGRKEQSKKFGRTFAPSCKKDSHNPHKGPTYPCPLCETWLKAGERLLTVTHKTGKGSEDTSKIVYIYGCPYCLPPAHSSLQHRQNRSPASGAHSGLLHKPKNRICPVCSYQLRQKDYLLGRMEEGDQKTSLKVIGCSSCNKRFKR